VKRQFSTLFTYFSVSVIALGASAAIVKTRSSPRAQTSSQKQTLAIDPAFRDGLYLGKLDAKSGRKAHLSVGRWNTAQDHASFVAGYEQGYQEGEKANPRKPGV
jgi:hypothetical protein